MTTDPRNRVVVSGSLKTSTENLKKSRPAMGPGTCPTSCALKSWLTFIPERFMSIYNAGSRHLSSESMRYSRPRFRCSRQMQMVVLTSSVRSMTFAFTLVVLP